MPSATSLQSYSPRALAPFDIENTLAPLATGGSAAEAQTMLDTYGLQRMAAGDQYGREVDLQHQQAMANIQQQMMDTQLKALNDAAKTPGMLGLLYSSPQYQGVFGGADPSAIQNASDFAARAARAKELQESGTGFNQYAQGGFQSPDIPASVGISGTMTDPALVRAAQIRAAAQLAAARLGAGASGAPSIHLTGPPDPDNPGANVTASWSGKAGQTPEGALAYGRQHGLLTAPLSTPPNKTNLAPAQQDEGTARSQPAPSQPAQTKAAPASPPGNKDTMDKVRTFVETNKDALGPKAYADIQAGMKMNGGNPILKPDASGRIKLYGQSGQSYP